LDTLLVKVLFPNCSDRRVGLISKPRNTIT